jgi:hypothetical protein
MWQAMVGDPCATPTSGGQAMKKPIENSRALWNRNKANLESDETLAQLLERGDLKDWRELYRLASTDVRLRSRIKRIVLTVPLPLPHFWLAVLAGFGESIDWDAPIPDYFESTSV